MRLRVVLCMASISAMQLTIAAKFRIASLSGLEQFSACNASFLANVSTEDSVLLLPPRTDVCQCCPGLRWE